MPNPAETLLATLDTFSHASGRTLRPYQSEPARAILRSIHRHQGHTITVMFARQMGKNELSAQLEAYLLTLYSARGGTLVKAAPSFKPQIINSLLRLKDTLTTNPLTRTRWRPQFGYILRLGDTSITFLSADPAANVVGATASLLLEIDEAQDIDPDTYDRHFRPMASSTNATTVLYGTAWSDDTILERQRRLNLAHEARTGERLHFEYPYTHLAHLNPHYKAFVEAEIARLGPDHPTIRTQYLLHTLADAGHLFSAHQRHLLQGTHDRHLTPHPDTHYIAGIDIAGEDEDAHDALARHLTPKRDSTVITIAAVTPTSDTSEPLIRIVHHLWWTGRDQVWQYQRLTHLWSRWNFTHVTVDASGIGHGLAQFLANRYPTRVTEYTFTAPSKSRLAYDLLAAINTERLTVYAPDGSPEHRQFWHEITHTRYRLRAGEQLTWSVPPTDGHDDFVVSLALAAHAATHTPPPPASALIRSLPDEDDGRY